ncbi:RNA polymerase sigma factor [Bacillus horti]|uniref:RNA polymerase sigma factor n=1 Tax=Caldalkalibacillus horti TaxID=77523 RepID=A0ABT9VY49_9BACI|nr:sigma-70 family RNA polymerase sigma factor [Bacillus horti]MDQ0165814.1 RNA polymerase sigma factor (sigma-70 family) [Bacillus horti]
MRFIDRHKSAFEHYLYFQEGSQEEVQADKRSAPRITQSSQALRELSEKDNMCSLVEKARSGDREAFGELVRKYRKQAFIWANSLTRDHTLAEDIVQEALIKAFLNLGSLMDTNRFLPWLRKIVTNQVYMSLRRGGPYAKEKPFSHYEQRKNIEQNETDWSNIDHVLTHLTSKLSLDLVHTQSYQADPQNLLMKKELVIGINQMLQCLSKREKAIFESFFFEQLSPQEIARIFSTTTSNVYNILSRSKGKVRREHIRVFLAKQLEPVIAEGRIRNILNKPINL